MEMFCAAEHMILFASSKLHPGCCVGQSRGIVCPRGRLGSRALGGGSGMERDSGCIWEVELPGFAEGLDVGSGKDGLGMMFGMA